LKEMFFPSCGSIPWLAIALIMGQADRESPSFGGTYSGHVRLCPVACGGTTQPGLREGVRRLRMKREKSQERTKMLMKKPATLLRKPMLISRLAGFVFGRLCAEVT
jgi:hypothetical protein